MTLTIYTCMYINYSLMYLLVGAYTYHQVLIRVMCASADPHCTYSGMYDLPVC